MAEPLVRLNQIVPNSSPLWTDASVNSTGTPPTVIAANQTRRGLMFANPGNVTIYVAPANGNPLAIGHGIPVLPQGAPLFIAQGDFQVNCAWQAIAASGSGNVLTILEFV
ncbi:MAG TPA: hypothetical protein VHY10_16375 [Xanthobacteraceae bacterium]|jgi:hypothetical protein|nr:hypothetical protein [Xanthobacteraceae bacterium]